MTSATFNANNYVWVRLTDHGRAIYAAWQDELRRDFPKLGPAEPRVEQDGWSKWQLWELMEMFGPHMSMAWPLPFETEIRLEAP